MREVKISNEFLSYAQKIGHKAKFTTNLFGKEYVWMVDTEGTYYLEKLF